MNIEQMYEMQCELDGRIIEQKGLRGKDLFPNTVLALDVEISELANEWRGFKHWSNNQQPRTKVEVICTTCDGTGDMNNEASMQHLMEGRKGLDFDPCTDCNATGKLGYRNPLLEEYVDCVHFFLSIARQKGWLDHLYISEDALEETREQGLDGGIGGALLEVKYWLLKMYMEKERDEKLEAKLRMTTQEFNFGTAWYVFIAIGLIGFGFTPEQIEAAYHEKNKVNHTRQQNGY